MSNSPKATRATAILEAGARLLNTNGVSDEWLGDIAAELGITRSALYSHFDGRDDLLFACYMRTIETCETVFEQLAAKSKGPANTFDAFLQETINESFPELAVVAEVDVLSSAKRDLVLTRWRALVARVASFSADGQRLGVFRAHNPMIAAQSLLGLATWTPLQRRLLPDRPTASVLVGAREILNHGIAQARAPRQWQIVDRRVSEAKLVDIFDRSSIIAAKRERLLGVASGFFNRRGIGATRVEEIAEAVGSNKRSIFRHFGTKDQLVAACFSRANAIALQISTDVVASSSTGADAVHDAVFRVVMSFSDPVSPSLSSHVGLGRAGPRAARCDATALRRSGGCVQANP